MFRTMDYLKDQQSSPELDINVFHNHLDDISAVAARFVVFIDKSVCTVDDAVLICICTEMGTVFPVN